MREADLRYRVPENDRTLGGQLQRSKRSLEGRGKALVYALVGPNGDVYYIGQTRDAHVRVAGHWAWPPTSDDWRAAWEVWLLDSDHSLHEMWRRRYTVLEETTTTKGPKRERWWYDRFNEIGANLSNLRRP